MASSTELESRLLEAITGIQAIDVHSHVPFDAPVAASLRELLGYHYFTELAHSAGVSKEAVAPEAADEAMLSAMVQALPTLDNTVQHGWLMEIARELFGFTGGSLTRENWEVLADSVRKEAAEPGRERKVLSASGIEKVFLTNAFDDDLSEVDREIFVPCLRADALVFRFAEADVRKRLEKVTGSNVGSAEALTAALEKLLERFVRSGAASVAISLPPDLRAYPVVPGDLETAVGKAAGGKPLSAAEGQTLRCGTLFALCDTCRNFKLPLQVMFGAVRAAYRHGVPQGTDLPQAGESLRALMPLFNSFPEVTFCVSALSDSQAQELASYGWIVRNVVVSGHWWYDGLPAYIERDLTARLQSVPKTKLIGYYSDMYKLEFGLPKFNMYRRVLARVLARDYVEGGRGSEPQAVEIARLLLRSNARRIFGV